MGAQRDQTPHPPMVVTNRGDGSWGSQGKRQKTQEGGYGKQYGTGGERRGYQTYRTDRTQPQSHNTAYGLQRQGSYFPTKSTGNEQGGNGGGEDRNDKKKYRDTRVNHENDSHEESDTENSYEFEITSQQLSQVTPGGGALKIKLSKKKPLKITAGTPDGQSKTIPMELERIWKGLPRYKVVIHGEVKGQLETEIHQEMGVEETLPEELVGIRDFQVKEGVLPEEMVIKEEEEMMILTLVMTGMEMILLLHGFLCPKEKKTEGT